MSDELLFEKTKEDILKSISMIRVIITGIIWLIMGADLFVKNEEGERMFNAVIKKYLHMILEEIGEIESNVAILEALIRKWQIANTE